MDPALWALLGVVVGALTTGIFGLLTQTRTFAHEKEAFNGVCAVDTALPLLDVVIEPTMLVAHGLHGSHTSSAYP